MRDFLVNLPKLIFDDMTADNFEHRNIPYGMVLTIPFELWGVDLSEKPFIALPRPFNRSISTAC